MWSFPAASLYEKAGTVTNTFGDVQLARKAADRAGVKPDFEILVPASRSDGRRCEDACTLRQERHDGLIWASRAARKPAKPTVMQSGWWPTVWNPS